MAGGAREEQGVSPRASAAVIRLLEAKQRRCAGPPIWKGKMDLLLTN